MPFEKVDGEKQIYRCGACNSLFQFGPHVYQGKMVPELNEIVCSTCAPQAWARADSIEQLKFLIGKRRQIEKS